MDLKKELIGLRIFMANYHTEIEKTYGENPIKAILFRMGHKPGDIIADEILKKYDKSPSQPFEVPTAAFTLFENTITKLYDTEIITQEEKDDRYILKIRNVCAFRNVIKSRTELEYGGTLCEFTVGYFETALKKMTGMNVEYQFQPAETTEEYCIVNLVFWKKDSSSSNSLTKEKQPIKIITENKS